MNEEIFGILLKRNCLKFDSDVSRNFYEENKKMLEELVG